MPDFETGVGRASSIAVQAAEPRAPSRVTPTVSGTAEALGDSTTQRPVSVHIRLPIAPTARRSAGLLVCSGGSQPAFLDHWGIHSPHQYLSLISKLVQVDKSCPQVT